MECLESMQPPTQYKIHATWGICRPNQENLNGHRKYKFYSKFSSPHSFSILDLDPESVGAAQGELVRLRSPLDIDLRAGDSECGASDLGPQR